MTEHVPVLIAVVGVVVRGSIVLTSRGVIAVIMASSIRPLSAVVVASII
jgi:hypothetical protein